MSKSLVSRLALALTISTGATLGFIWWYYRRYSGKRNELDDQDEGETTENLNNVESKRDEIVGRLRKEDLAGDNLKIKNDEANDTTTTTSAEPRQPGEHISMLKSEDPINAVEIVVKAAEANLNGEGIINGEKPNNNTNNTSSSTSDPQQTNRNGQEESSSGSSNRTITQELLIPKGKS